MPRPRKYSETTRVEATSLFTTVGPAQAERQTGIPRQTILRWLQEATNPAPPPTVAVAQAAARIVTAEETKQMLVERLTMIADVASLRMAQMIVDGSAGVKLSEVVAAFDRSLHHLALMSGLPTAAVSQVGSPADVLGEAKQRAVELRSIQGGAA